MMPNNGSCRAGESMTTERTRLEGDSGGRGRREAARAVGWVVFQQASVGGQAERGFGAGNWPRSQI